MRSWCGCKHGARLILRCLATIYIYIYIFPLWIRLRTPELELVRFPIVFELFREAKLLQMVNYVQFRVWLSNGSMRSLPVYCDKGISRWITVFVFSLCVMERIYYRVLDRVFREFRQEEPSRCIKHVRSIVVTLAWHNINLVTRLQTEQLCIFHTVILTMKWFYEDNYPKQKCS